MAVFLACGCVAAEEIPPPISGYRGAIQISLQTDVNEITVRFTSETAFPDGAQEVRFVLQQYDGAATPSAWKGQGRLLLSEGLLAVITGDGSKLVFKFPERALPDGWSGQATKIYPVYGIARYARPKRS